MGSRDAPSRRWAGPPVPPRRCCAAAGKPASAAPASHPRPSPRRAASSGATWRPGPRLPPRPGLTAPQLSGRLAPASPTPAQLGRGRPAGPRSLWESPPAPAWPGRGRSAPASLPDPVAVLAAAKGPGGLPRSPGEAVLDVGPGPCTSLCRGEEAYCKLQQVVEDAALAESAGKTPALGAPHPTQPVPHRVITVITPLYSPRDCECLEGSFCVSPGQCCSSQ